MYVDPRFLDLGSWFSLHSLGTDRIENTAYNSSVFAWLFVTAETCLPYRCLAMYVFSGSAIPASCHIIDLHCSTFHPIIYEEETLIYDLVIKNYFELNSSVGRFDFNREGFFSRYNKDELNEVFGLLISHLASSCGKILNYVL
jgi:hypothetical protein